jgi:hypothetical protein
MSASPLPAQESRVARSVCRKWSSGWLAGWLAGRRWVGRRWVGYGNSRGTEAHVDSTKSQSQAHSQQAVRRAEAQGQVSRTPTQTPRHYQTTTQSRPGRAQHVVGSKLHRPPSIALARKHEGVGLGGPASGHVVGFVRLIRLSER